LSGSGEDISNEQPEKIFWRDRSISFGAGLLDAVQPGRRAEIKRAPETKFPGIAERGRRGRRDFAPAQTHDPRVAQGGPTN